MIEKLKKFAQEPATKEALQSLKPQKSILGIIGVIFFFILPEIIAFVWGEQIHTFIQEALKGDLPLENQYFYKGLDMLFSEPSYLNLLLGFALLIWLFF